MSKYSTWTLRETFSTVGPTSTNSTCWLKTTKTSQTRTKSNSWIKKGSSSTKCRFSSRTTWTTTSLCKTRLFTSWRKAKSTSQKYSKWCWGDTTSKQPTSSSTPRTTLDTWSHTKYSISDVLIYIESLLYYLYKNCLLCCLF